MTFRRKQPRRKHFLDPRSDKITDQKFSLVQLAGSVKPDGVLGLKVLGTYKTMDDLDAHMKDVEGGYFQVNALNVGRWVTIPEDYKPKTRDDMYVKSDMFEEKISLADLKREKANKDNERSELEAHNKHTMRQNTYFLQPDTEDKVKELLRLIELSAEAAARDFCDFKNMIVDNEKKLEEMEDEEDEEDGEEEEGEDLFYIDKLVDSNINQKYALLSYVDVKGTRQRGKCFSMKIRGAYATQEEVDAAVEEFKKMDPNFDIFKIEVGRWYALPRGGKNDTQKDLNKLLGKIIVDKNREDAEFAERINRAKNNEVMEEIKWSKSDIEYMIEDSRNRASKCEKDLKEYIELYEYNLETHKDKLPENYENVVQRILEKYGIKIRKSDPLEEKISELSIEYSSSS